MQDQTVLLVLQLYYTVQYVNIIGIGTKTLTTEKDTYIALLLHRMQSYLPSSSFTFEQRVDKRNLPKKYLAWWSSLASFLGSAVNRNTSPASMPPKLGARQYTQMSRVKPCVVWSGVRVSACVKSGGQAFWLKVTVKKTYTQGVSYYLVL